MGEVHTEGLPNGDEASKQESAASCSGPQNPIRFAGFELRTETRELSKQGVRVKLQIKPFQVLETLLARPGELVTREELRNKLWPSGTFVDFESGLNTAINRLRAALGDCADEPRFIQTLPRLGYRFVCPIESGTSETALVVKGQDPTAAAAPPVHEQAVPEVYLKKNTKRQSGAGMWLAGSLLCAALVFALFQVRTLHHQPADFRPVSFRGGTVISARFLAGSQVVYSAKLNDVRQTFVANMDGTNNVKLAEGIVVAASPQGDVAILGRDLSKKDRPLRLTRASVGGESSGVLAESAFVADWSPDGKQLAVVREVGSEYRLEFPQGKVIFCSQGMIDGLRVSRDGREVAFLEHPVRDDDGGHVAMVDASGRSKVLTGEWSSAEGLAWSPSGREIWFTASKAGLNKSLYSVSRSGKLRKISEPPLSLRLLDVARDGRTLLAMDEARMILRTGVDGEEAEISQFDSSHVDDMTPDGKTLLFTEGGNAGGQHYAAYVYDRTSKKAKRFGSGHALSLSADGKQALTVDPQDRTVLTITSLASGEVTRVQGNGFRYQWARFTGDGDLMVGGSYAGKPLMIAYQAIGTGIVRPIPDAPYFDYVAISPDGTKIAGGVGGATEIIDLPSKSTHRLPPGGLTLPLVWSADGKSLFLLTACQSNYAIVQLSMATHRSTSWKTIDAQDATFIGLAGIAAAPNSGAYAYSANLNLSRLYVVNGLT